MGFFRSEAYSKNDITYKRDNYHKWPWTAILVTCFVCGVIFLLAGIPRNSDNLSGSGVPVSITLLVLGSLSLLPVVIVIPYCLCHKVYRTCDAEVPSCCHFLEPFTSPNKKIKENISFYDHPAKDLKSYAVDPSVYVIPLPSSSHMGESSDFTEVSVDNKRYSSNPNHSINPNSSKSLSYALRQPNLREETSHTQLTSASAGRRKYNRAYLENETSSRTDLTASGHYRSNGGQGSTQYKGKGEIAKHHYTHNRQPNGYDNQPIEVHVQILDSGNNSPQDEKMSSISKTSDLNNNTVENTRNSEKVSMNSNISKRASENGVSVQSSDLISQEYILLFDENQEDKNSAVCDVEDYVFGGDELIDARSDFNQERHSPHTKTDQPPSEFEFDHSNSHCSSQTFTINKKETTSNLSKNGDDVGDDDECSSYSIISDSCIHNINAPSITVNGDLPEPVPAVSERSVVSKALTNGDLKRHDSTDKAHMLRRHESDRSLASFFMKTPYVSQEKLDFQAFNSNYDSEDAYSLVSESEYSYAAEKEASRARLDWLEERHASMIEQAPADTCHSASYYGTEYDDYNDPKQTDQNDWKNTLWDKSSEPVLFALPSSVR